jgi:hypothetical protein
MAPYFGADPGLAFWSGHKSWAASGTQGPGCLLHCCVAKHLRWATSWYEGAPASKTLGPQILLTPYCQCLDGLRRELGRWAKHKPLGPFCSRDLGLILTGTWGLQMSGPCIWGSLFLGGIWNFPINHPRARLSTLRFCVAGLCAMLFCIVPGATHHSFTHDGC